MISINFAEDHPFAQQPHPVGPELSGRRRAVVSPQHTEDHFPHGYVGRHVIRLRPAAVLHQQLVDGDR